MDDLISRQAAIDVLAEMQGRCTSKAALIQNSKIWQQIKDLPSAKHEQKPGRWNFIGDNMFECTNCKVVYTTNQLNSLRNYDTDPYAPRFCPNCGAKMDEEGKDD